MRAHSYRRAAIARRAAHGTTYHDARQTPGTEGRQLRLGQRHDGPALGTHALTPVKS
jgi:hypothetical protein